MVRLAPLVFLLLTLSSFNPQSRRIVYIFGSGKNEAQVIEQFRLFQERAAECRERDLDVIIVHKSTDPKRLYLHHGVHVECFAIILIGKDGTEKYRNDQITQPNKLFALIDSMPMRQYEIRQKKRAG